MDFLDLDYYNIPRVCKECGGVMIFQGVGEYQCEKCNLVAYDDYGKVRLYIETHAGANAAEIEANTGVSQRTIRRMLRESRLAVAEGSSMMLHCEICREPIRYGRLCSKCEIKHHRRVEEQQRRKQNMLMQGFGMNKENWQDGEKRFIRKDSQ